MSARSNSQIIGTNFYDCWWADGAGGNVIRISSLISYRAVPKVKHPRGSGREFSFERVWWRITKKDIKLQRA
jgi:hypothetical protein